MTRAVALALVCLASFGWALGFGVAATLSPLWLRDAGASAASIGTNAALYYLGVAVASPLVPALMRRAGRACVAGGVLLDAVAVALFPLADGLGAWHALRFLGGVGTALSIVPLETLVNRNAAPDRRARDFAAYALCVALGVALGQAAVPLYPHAPRLAFALGGAVTCAAACLCLALPAPPAQEDDAGGAFPLRPSLFALGTAWAQGFLEGGTFAFLSLFLLSRHGSEAVVGPLLGATFAGVVAAQLPLAWLADRLGRLRVLVACHVVLLAGLALVPALTSPVPTAAALFVLGAACGALYPLGLALLGERVEAGGLAKANAWYLACNCAGSLTGPLALGLAIDAFGLPAQFALDAAAVALVLGLAALGRRPAGLCRGRRAA